MESATALKCPPDVLLANAVERWAELRGQLACAQRPVDLSALARFDSAAVALLVALRREFGPAVRFVNPPNPLRALATLYDVAALLFDEAPPEAP